ncbi:NepR family anti-sigma factor [Methylobacterium sp. WSM2598]|uniref:NepR family anti-sigma factor n=1 Tax=Methylobacterium sp. WSM2598 TaxID=398261 RepID=UPI00039FFEA2|nr:sigma-70 family RNA polymerase sigma factor [Methylobacterium sp. WSM2598]
MAPDETIPAAADPGLAGDVPADTRPRLPRFVHAALGTQLRAAYAAVMGGPQPQALLDLIARLDAAQAARPASTFREDLLGAVPALRAYALSLTILRAEADDLVQETLLRAWQNQDRFAPGTNLKAWLFTILRNQFYIAARKRRREVEDADGEQAARMVALPDQEDGIALQDVWKRLGQLPAPQREALLLVAAQGLTYEAAAELMGCRVGTAKSRVNRARAALAQALGYEGGRSGRMLTS